MPSDGVIHKVAQGETTTGLAYANGLLWDTIWNHPNNSGLKKRRTHPNILYPGDEIFIPNRRERIESRATGARHKFVRRGVPEKFNMQFLDSDGVPYSGVTYVLTVEGKITTGNLDGDGWIRVPLPPDARAGHIDVGESGSLASCDLQFGCLDPVSTISGVQGRLRNLGYYDGPIDGSENEALDAAVQEFRQTEGLSEDGEIDDEFRARLEKLHYS